MEPPLLRAPGEEEAKRAGNGPAGEGTGQCVSPFRPPRKVAPRRA